MDVSIPLSEKWGLCGEKSQITGNKKGLTEFYKPVNPLLLLVPGTRIELVHAQGIRDFKSLASTYSATQAYPTTQLMSLYLLSGVGVIVKNTPLVLKLGSCQNLFHLIKFFYERDWR